jgi:hypothetical protein
MTERREGRRERRCRERWELERRRAERRDAAALDEHDHDTRRHERESDRPAPKHERKHDDGSPERHGPRGRKRVARERRRRIRHEAPGDFQKEQADGELDAPYERAGKRSSEVVDQAGGARRDEWRRS